MYIIAPRCFLLEIEAIKTLSVRLLPAKDRAARPMAVTQCNTCGGAMAHVWIGHVPHEQVK